jgi:hypothetical protein
VIDLTATLRDVTIGTGTIYPWRGTAAAGLLDTAPIRSTDEPYPRRDGVIAGADYYGSRLVVFEMLIQQGKAGNEAAMTALSAAFAASQTDLWLDVRITGDPAEYSLRGRPRGVTFVIDRERWDAGVVDARASFLATDPVRYGAEMSAALAVADPFSGLALPASFPAAFAAGGGASTAAVSNPGNSSIDWQATLQGPLTSPRLALDGSGRSVRVAAEITAGQSVVLDSASGAILLDGTAPRPQWFAPGSRWFRLPPGGSSVTFTADSGDGNATLTWRPGWV